MGIGVPRPFSRVRVRLKRTNEIYTGWNRLPHPAEMVVVGAKTIEQSIIGNGECRPRDGEGGGWEWGGEHPPENRGRGRGCAIR